MIGIKLGLALGGNATGGSAFALAFTGLTDGVAVIGDHASIGYTIDPDNGTETVKWSNSADSADAATYGTGSNPTDFTAGDEGTLYLHVTDDGETVSRSALIRYAAGAAPAVADGQSWTVDDTSVNIDGAASGANLTFSYVLSGQASGVSINSGTGAITGTPDTVESGTATITATDQYGRTLQDTFTFTSALRTQATGGSALDLSFPEGSAITSTDLTANWTENGNTLTYAIFGTALPSALTASTAGAMTGTPFPEAADATYILRGTDEYGRTTDANFTLEITNVAVPTVSGSIADKDFTLNFAIPTIVTSGQFSGTVDSYSASGLPVGVSINTSTGDITGTATEEEDIGANAIEVFAHNGGGSSAALEFDMDMASGAVVVDGGTNTASVDAGADTGEITINIGGTDYTFDTTDLDTFAGLAPNAPTISRTTGASDVVGSTYTAVEPAVLYDSAKSAPTVTGIWRVDAADQTGETDPDAYVTDTAGDIDYEMNITGTGTAVAIDSDDIAVSAGDVTAPTLSSPTDAANGETASTASVSTNEGNGTLYVVVTTSATAPTAAQVKLGQDNSGSAAAFDASQAVSGTGVQTITPAPSGLTASTAYTTHFMHEDGASNQSSVSSASGFTTASASSFSSSRAASGSREVFVSPGSATFTTSALPISESPDANRVVYAAIQSANTTGDSFTSAPTIQGADSPITATLVDTIVNSGDAVILLYKATVPTGTTVVVSGTLNATPSRLGVDVVSATNVTTETTAKAESDSAGALDLSVATVSGGHLWVFGQSENANAWPAAVAGYTMIDQRDLTNDTFPGGTSGEYMMIGQATSLSTETRTVTAPDIGDGDRVAAMSLALS